MSDGVGARSAATPPHFHVRGHNICKMIGADGFATLLLSNLIIFASTGLSLLWMLARVHRVARSTGIAAPPLGLAMVLGYRLDDNKVVKEFGTRLLRARRLYKQGCIRRILIVGGRTGTASVSEAQQGRRFLASRGVPDEVVDVEENSTHTLENLRNARATLEAHADVSFILITSRYHLARGEALATGLGLRPVLCSAEDRLAHDWATLLRLIGEAWFLHWYYVGRYWSRWTGSRKSLARIS